MNAVFFWPNPWIVAIPLYYLRFQFGYGFDDDDDGDGDGGTCEARTPNGPIRKTPDERHR